MVAKMCCYICSLQCSWNFSKEPGFSSIAAHWLLNNSWFRWPGGKKVFYTGAVILLCPPKTAFFFFFFTWSLTSERDDSVPDIIYCSPSTHWKPLKSHSKHSSRAAVPNLRVADWYRSMGHSVPGHTERKNNLHYFVLFIWNWMMFSFEKSMDALRYVRLWLTIDICLLYLEKTQFSCWSYHVLFGVFLCHTLKVSNWKSWRRLNWSVTQNK